MVFAGSLDSGENTETTTTSPGPPQILDTNQTGEITREDLLVLAAIPGSKFTDAHVKFIMEDCDKDGNGVISIDELFKAVTQGSLAFSVLLTEVSGKRTEIKTDQCSRDQLCTYMKRGLLWNILAVCWRILHANNSVDRYGDFFLCFSRSASPGLI